jgi:hypothetical protein
MSPAEARHHRRGRTPGGDPPSYAGRRTIVRIWPKRRLKQANHLFGTLANEMKQEEPSCRETILTCRAISIRDRFS